MQSTREFEGSLGQVFNPKLGHIGRYCMLSTSYIWDILEFKAEPRFCLVS